MARPAVACTVPGCKGRIERGKHPDGAVREWCSVCERRILQLKALQQQIAVAPPPSSGPLGAVDDARLATLIAERCVNQAQAHKVTGRSINLIREGIQKAQFPAARIGRYAVIPKASLVAWSKAYRPDQRMHVRTQASLYALPRDAAAAVTVEQWELRAKRSAQSLATLARSHRKDPRLQVVGAVSPAGRPVLAYWWQEPQEGAGA